MRPTGRVPSWNGYKDAPNSVHYVDIVDKATHTLLKREFLATAPEAHLRRVQLEAMLLQVHPEFFAVRVYEVHRVSGIGQD
jgi:hypothetical protein